MVVQPKGERMKSKGMVLYMNRNTKTTTGKYIVSETLHDEDGRPKSKDKEYPVKMVDNKLHQLKISKTKNKKEIENFKFLFNTATLKICRSTKTAIYHTIQRCRVIQPNIN